METMWHYVKNGTERFGPVPEPELLALASSGRVLPTDLVWCEGMQEWLAMNCVPTLSGQPASTTAAMPGAAATVQGAAPLATGPSYARSPAAYRPSLDAAEVPPGLGGWMSFVGVMNIIGGSITCLVGVLSIVTIIGPIIYIPLGIMLIMAGTALTAGKNALLGAASFDPQIEMFLQKIKRYMAIQGAFFIFSLAITVLGIIAALVAIFGMGINFAEMLGQSGQR